MAAAFGAVGKGVAWLFGKRKKKPEVAAEETTPAAKETVPATPMPANKAWSDSVLAGAQQAQRVLAIAGAKKQRRPGVNPGLRSSLGAAPGLRGIFG